MFGLFQVLSNHFLSTEVKMQHSLTAHWLVLSDERQMTIEERRADFFSNGQIPIQVLAHRWQLNDTAKTIITKDYSKAKYSPQFDVLPDMTGVIVTEPFELVGDRRVVVYNADGSERFRLEPKIDKSRFPAYMHNARLTGFSESREHPGWFAAKFEDEDGRGWRILEFDPQTGLYTGKFVSTVHEW